MIIKLLAFVAHSVVNDFKRHYESFDPEPKIIDESVAGFSSAVVVPAEMDPADAHLPGMMQASYKGPMIGFLRSQDDILITAEGDD